MKTIVFFLVLTGFLLAQQGGITYQVNQSTALSGLGFPALPSAYVVPIPATALASGENDIYTVPTGMRATLALSVTNISGLSVNQTNQIKVGGNYFQVGTLGAIVNNSQGTLSIPFNTLPILEAGESFSQLTSATGLTVFGYAIVFSNTEPLLSPKLTTLAAGNNTIYTCPAGKVAFITNVGGSNAILRIYNASGNTRTYSYNAVPAGGSVSSSNQLMAAFTLANLTQSSQTNNQAGLAATGFISLNSDSSAAGQVAYIPNIVELPVR